jgi:hypothetical protein
LGHAYRKIEEEKKTYDPIMFVVESPQFIYIFLIRKSDHIRSTYLNTIYVMHNSQFRSVYLSRELGVVQRSQII